MVRPRRGQRGQPSTTAKRWLKVLGTLNEAQARWFVADQALDLGRGGVTRLAGLTGLSRTTIPKGSAELAGRGRLLLAGRIRGPGAGRKRVAEVAPGRRPLSQRIIDEPTAGDPERSLRWTSKATRTMAEERRRRGHPVSAVTVGRCLRALDSWLHANRKSKAGPQHRDRDAQCRYLNRQVKGSRQGGDPILSVDAKKTELGGEFRNAGPTWRRKGPPQAVNVHDFLTRALGKGIPGGAYDPARNRAGGNVGIAPATAEFAVASIRRWGRVAGRRAYPRAKRRLICAASGGSNGPRLRAWKLGLPRLAAELCLPITLCHSPPGTSKGTKIEHRLCALIRLNWRGRPLINYATRVNLIGGTRTRSGLRVTALRDTHAYPTGITGADHEIEKLELRRHRFHPDWNYTLAPTRSQSSK